MSIFKKSIFYGLQPTITIVWLLIWLQFHQQYNALVSLLIVLLSIIFAILERIFPERSSWLLSRNEFAKDMFYQLGIYFIYGPFMVMVASQFFIEYLGNTLKGEQYIIWPTEWPLIPKIFLALIVSEFFGYWFHRAEHRFRLLWRLHSVHHSPNKMGWTKTAVNHPFEYFILVVIGVLPATIFGAQVPELEAATLLYLVTAQFAHCNLQLNHRWLSVIFTTNKLHYRHHSPILKESLSNFGCALLIWDHIFGTFKGIQSCGRVGIATGNDLTLAQELILPFRRVPLGININTPNSFYQQ